MNGEAVGGRWNEGAHVRCALGRIKASLQQGGAGCAGRGQAPKLRADPPSPLSQVCSRPLTHRRLSGSRTITQQALAERLGRAAHPSATPYLLLLLRLLRLLLLLLRLLRLLLLLRLL